MTARKRGSTPRQGDIGSCDVFVFVLFWRVDERWGTVYTYIAEQKLINDMSVAKAESQQPKGKKLLVADCSWIRLLPDTSGTCGQHSEQVMYKFIRSRKSVVASWT